MCACCSASTELRLTLSALRYLDTVYDSERLCQQLVQTMGLISDCDVLREVVMAVPEIIGSTAQQVRVLGTPPQPAAAARLFHASCMIEHSSVLFFCVCLLILATGHRRVSD